jgi:hypothetical protein
MKRSAFIIILSAVTVASVLAVAGMSIEMQGALRRADSAERARALAERDRNAAREQLVQAPAREAAELAVRNLREQLAQARSEKEALQRSVNDQEEQLGEEQSARKSAERALKDTRERMAIERTAREAAEAAVSETREQLIQERTAREAAEGALKDRRERLAQERSGRGGERATKDLRGGHGGLNDLGPLFDLGQALLFGTRFQRVR